MPSFTFVSTANAVRAARRRCPSSSTSAPTRSTSTRRSSRPPSRRAPARSSPVHYAGVGCEMDAHPRRSPARHGLAVIEDAAQGVIGHLQRPAARHASATSARSASTRPRTSSAARAARCSSTTPRCVERAEILREKGTNRSQLLPRRRSTSTPGSTSARRTLPSELDAAFLWAQLEHGRRDHRAGGSRSGRATTSAFAELEARRPAAPARRPGRLRAQRPHVLPAAARDRAARDALIDAPRARGIHAVFHYVPLHASPRPAGATARRRGAPRHRPREREPRPAAPLRRPRRRRPRAGLSRRRKRPSRVGGRGVGP